MDSVATPWSFALSRVDLSSVTRIAGLAVPSDSNGCPRLLRSLACRDIPITISSESCWSSSSVDDSLPSKIPVKVMSRPSGFRTWISLPWPTATWIPSMAAWAALASGSANFGDSVFERLKISASAGTPSVKLSEDSFNVDPDYRVCWNNRDEIVGW